MRINKLGLILTFAALAAPSTASAQELQHVGVLNCLATRAEAAPTEDATKLACELELFGRDPALKLQGMMVGRGLYLRDPGTMPVIWSVLAPTRDVEPTALAGDYDARSKHGFPRVQERTDVLAGGMNGSIVLQLVTPVVDAIGPETRLSLREADQAERG